MTTLTPARRAETEPAPVPPEPAPRRPVPPAVAWSCVATAGGVLLLLAVGPEQTRAPATLLLFAWGLTALAVGPRRNGLPADRGPWNGILAAMAAFLVTSLMRAVVPGADAVPPGPMTLFPSTFALVAYAGLGFALAGMLRRRRAADDDPARVDALLVGIAAAFLTWTYLMAPAVADANLSAVRLVDAFFPVIDVVLIVLAAQLALAGGVRQPALWLLLTGVTAMFVGDTLFMLRDGQLVDVSSHTVDTLFMVAVVGVAAAALHPSMCTLTEPQRVVVTALGRTRIILLGAVVLIPVVLSCIESADTATDAAVRSGLCVLLIAAVLTRVVRANNSRARAEQATRRRATHDALTDLPNRELLTETIAAWAARAAAEELEVSLLFIDLDRFKMVNDHWGHEVGDELLCAVAGRLSAKVRDGDLVCRIGGDEFVVAMASPSHSALAESVAGRLLAEFARPFELSVGSVVVTPSIGVARSTGATNAVELIRDADTAMYKAKGSGRNAYALFDTSLRDQVRRRMDLEQALRGALQRGELSVHYQPIIDLRGDEVDGFEALMRWTHPTLGFVSPLDFIEISEETGLIVEIGAWLLHESAAQLVTWTAQRPADARPLHISVNVSVRQLRADFVDTVREVLSQTGLPPESLWLEITESGVMDDVDQALTALRALRGLGVTLCVDDFGTGYSSLSYLARLPVSIVKVDRSFVAGVGEDGPNEPIVRAVLAMTRAMGYRVVAEGVETAVQRNWLREQGCDLAQGWYYGKAEPPAALQRWVTA